MKQIIKEAEFRGFFFADGCVSLHSRRTRNIYVRKDGTKAKDWHISHIVRVQITQRIDNLKLLEEYKDLFGGQIYLQRNVRKTGKYTHKPSAYWAVQKTDLCNKVLKILLDTQFTYRSIDAVKAAYEYTSWKLNRGLQKKLTDKDRQKVEEWLKRVKSAHQYKEQQF